MLLPKPPDKTPKKPPWNRRADKKRAKISEMQEFEAILKAFSPNNVKSSMLDSGTTCNLNKATDELPITGQSNKSILTATGNIIQTTAMATLPMTQLPDEARTTHILPNLQESLMSVSVLADNRCTTIFHPHQGGVTVHRPNGVRINVTTKALLQGWRDPDGLWRVPLTNGSPGSAMHTIALDRPAPLIAVNSVYELPSTEKVV
jgi:hypothetical protein